MKRYSIVIHRDKEPHLIEYVEKRKKDGERTSDIFKDGLQTMIDSEE